jgi:hypothetical protein
MTLGKRALLVIFPVILIIQLLASTTAYLTQRASLLGLEQARLEQQLLALQSAYLDYEAFNRSVLYSIMDSEALLLFLRESDTAFRNDTLGLRIQQSIRSLSNTELSFVSFAVLQPDGEPAYYFESSLSPFASMDETQRQIVAEARRSSRPGATRYVAHADGGPLLLDTDFILPASSSRPCRVSAAKPLPCSWRCARSVFSSSSAALKRNTAPRSRSSCTSCRSSRACLLQSRCHRHCMHG